MATKECPTGPIWSITLIRPWGWCITGFKPGQYPIDPKRIENRTYPPPRGIETGLLVLHAGKSVDSEMTTHLVGQLGALIPDTGDGVIGVCRCTGYVQSSDDIWFNGPFGWVLTDVVAISPPLRMRGHLGCHRVPTPLARTVRGLYMNALADGNVVP